MKIKTKSRIDHLEVLLRRVREASRINERTYRVRKYLDSFDAKLHATFEAWDAMEEEDRPDPAKLESIASNLDAWKGTDEQSLRRLEEYILQCPEDTLLDSPFSKNGQKATVSIAVEGGINPPPP
jgi:hypothetical protein